MAILGQRNGIDTISTPGIQDAERCAPKMSLEIRPRERILEQPPRCLLLVEPVWHALIEWRCRHHGPLGTRAATDCAFTVAPQNHTKNVEKTICRYLERSPIRLATTH